MFNESSPPNVTSIPNCHSLIFCIDRPVGSLVWFIVCVPSGLVGSCASAWLLWVFVQRWHSGSPNDIFMFHLTIMDLIHNSLVVPFLLNHYIWRSEQFVLAFLFFLWFGLNGRPLLMTCVCVDCYLAVVHPIAYMKTMKRRYKMVVCALVWILTIVYGLCNIFLNINSMNLHLVIPYALYLPTIIICDFCVLCALRKPDPSGRNTIHPQKQRAQQTIINSLVMSIVAYIPPVITGSVWPLLHMSRLEITCDVFIPALIAPCLGSDIMPILYLGNLGQLKQVWDYIAKRCGKAI